ncbi:hypothetical protein BOO92_13680 [Vibrio navarrensis]|nr:hypothetical protein [Vibrio navarrensis]HDY8121305.1 hypothetical protein [Vibrio vulnificus]
MIIIRKTIAFCIDFAQAALIVLIFERFSGSVFGPLVVLIVFAIQQLSWYWITGYSLGETIAKLSVVDEESICTPSRIQFAYRVIGEVFQLFFVVLWFIPVLKKGRTAADIISGSVTLKKDYHG